MNNKLKISNKTQWRIISIIMLLLLLGLAAEYYYDSNENKRICKIVESEKTDNLMLVRKIIEFKSSGLKAYTNDYTYWDEMVNFVKTGDSVWAKGNIDESLNTYGADFVWVYDSFSRLKYFTNTEKVRPEPVFLLTDDMLALIKNDNRFAHFFVKYDKYLIEICEITIHPTADPERLTEPKGYFAAGRLWSYEYLDEISKLTGNELSLDPKIMPDTSVNSESIELFKAINISEIKDHNGNVCSYLISSIELNNLKSIYNQNHSVIIILKIIITFGLLFCIAALYSLINYPLKQINRALTTGEIKYVEKLRFQQNEFGHMSRMIIDFFEQKNKLIKEINDRIDAENKIRLSEEMLKGSLAEKEVLIKEVHHRVKNNLQIIISLIRLQTNRLEDGNIIIQLNDILNRIKSIALVHELLYRSEDLSRIDLDSYLNKIVDSIRLIYNGKASDIKFNITSNNVFLTVEKAVPCAVIINELITNSIKHAFINKPYGEINIIFERIEDKYCLKISDNGIGLPADLDICNADSLGMYLISSLAEQLDAKICINGENGTTFKFTFPAV